MTVAGDAASPAGSASPGGTASQGGAQGSLEPLDDADRVTLAVELCPGVSRLSPGVLGEVATYLPGRRVVGVRVTPDTVEVHVVLRYGSSVDAAADQVRQAVSVVLPGRRIDVAVDDVDVMATPGA